jgi:hypothetical protein
MFYIMAYGQKRKVKTNTLAYHGHTLKSFIVQALMESNGPFLNAAAKMSPWLKNLTVADATKLFRT